jgi:hypothetical protein
MPTEEFLAKFSQLNLKRNNLIVSLEENNMPDILSVLTEIYPDEAHFVYELLQNAEDAEASEATFFLNQTGLIFQHNGKKKFNFENIEAITSVNNSTKVNEVNKIGKFGVGFKSVFAYCSKPIINSDNFTFEIEKMFIPQINDQTQSIFGAEKTTFILPFNEKTKLPKIAWKEISVGLSELDEKALLFLSHLKSIEIRISGAENRHKTIKRIKETSSRRKFEIVSDGQLSASNYFVFSEKMPQINQTEIDESVLDRLQNLTIAVAFEANETPAGEFLISPAARGNVSVYFPAIKEYSGLKFHIHAPFASTPSRDVIKDTKENAILLKGLADLASSKMIELKETGLMKEGLFACLPNAKDQLSSVYEPFRIRMLEVFSKGEKLIPTADNDFCAYEIAISSTQLIQESVDEEFMNLLLEREPSQNHPALRYVKVFKESRANDFLASLRIRSLGLTEIRRSLLQKTSDNQIAKLVDLLRELSMNRLRKFICLFSGSTADIALELSHLPLILTEGKEAEFSIAKNVFLPTKDFTSGAKLVSRNFYNANNVNPDGLDATVERSLVALGVRALDNWALFDLDLDRISKAHKFGDPVKPEDLDAAFTEFEKIGRAVGIDKERIKKVSGLNIVVGYTSEEKLVWTSINRSFIDAPFRSTGLQSVRSVFDAGSVMTRLWERYATFPRIDLFLDNSSILTGFKPKKSISGSNSNDWSIPNLSEMLEVGDIDFSLSIWNLLIDFANDKLRWHESSRRSGSTWITEDSNFIFQLKNTHWIPDNNNKKFMPSKINRNQLHSRFAFRDTELIHAIKFDGESKEAQAKMRAEAAALSEKNTMARELGFSDFKEVELLQKIKQKNPEALRNLYQSLESIFPEDLVDDIDDSILATTKAIGTADEVRFVETMIRERKNYGTSHAEMKSYVRRKYEFGGIMKCQSCALIMPFRLKSGEFYFEAVFAFKDLPKDVLENVLAFCPTCAAKYKYALETSRIVLKSAIKSAKILGTGTVSIPLRMAGSDFQLTFTEEHFLALQTVLTELD